MAIFHDVAITGGISELIAPEYLKMQHEVERRLALLGMTPEEISKRAYVIIDGNKRTYFFDGVPIIESDVNFLNNTIILSVRPVQQVDANG